jgi:hypothetical protein
MLIGHDPDLDQLVARKVLVNFVHDGRGQAGIADHHNRIERVGAGAQFAALSRGQV